MNRKIIVYLLQENWRGLCNDQPSAEQTADILIESGVNVVELAPRYDSLILGVEKPLTASQAWFLARAMRADEPERIEDGSTRFSFWWD